MAQNKGEINNNCIFSHRALEGNITRIAVYFGVSRPAAAIRIDEIAGEDNEFSI